MKFKNNVLNMLSLIFLIIFVFIHVDVEVFQLVGIFARRHHSEPITQIVLLQVFLC